MNQIIPIASGKGGVGKTILASSLGYLLSSMGKTVLMVDLDLGASNLHSCLGVPNTNPGISSFLRGDFDQLEQLIVATPYPRLYLVPGDQMIPGVANIPFYKKVRLITELQRQVADYIIVDLGAGSAFNTVDFFLAARYAIVISSAEPTSILNSYAFIKTACYRMLLRSFPRKSRERALIHEYLSQRIEGTNLSFNGLVRELGGINGESEALARRQLNEFGVRVIINMGRHQNDIKLGARLRDVIQKNVGVQLDFIGFIPYEPETYKSILTKKPMPAFMPESPLSRALGETVQRLVHSAPSTALQLHEADEDIQMLQDLYNRYMSSSF